MEQFKTCYQYDEHTGAMVMEYRAQLSPTEPEVKDKEGRVISEAVYIKPTHATFIAPPPCKINEIPVFSEPLQAWAIKPDFRGQIWFKIETGEPVEIAEIGQPDSSLAPELTDSVALAKAKQETGDALRYACAAHITEGFDCDALGQMYHYPFNIMDQHNLSIAGLAAISAPHDEWTVPIKCRDANGTWARIPHTSQQVIIVLHSAVAHRDGLSAKMESMDSEIEAARTVADVEKITW